MGRGLCAAELFDLLLRKQITWISNTRQVERFWDCKRTTGVRDRRGLARTRGIRAAGAAAGQSKRCNGCQGGTKNAIANHDSRHPVIFVGILVVPDRLLDSGLEVVDPLDHAFGRIKQAVLSTLGTLGDAFGHMFGDVVPGWGLDV